MFPRLRRSFTVVVVLAMAGALLLAPTASGTVGTQLWVARFAKPTLGNDIASSMATSPDGTKVFVTGSTYQGTACHDCTSPADYETVAYDAVTGAEIWKASYNGPGNADDKASSVRVAPDGTKVFVTGASRDASVYYNYATIAYDASSGTQLWVSRYQGQADYDSSAHALVVSLDGSKVLVTGESKMSSTGFDYATVAYDAATGAQLWASRYDGPATGADFAHAMALSPGGATVYVTGESWGGASHVDFATVAYDVATGAQGWVSRHSGPGFSQEMGQVIAASPAGGRVFVAGESQGTTKDYDIVTICIGAGSGKEQWAMRYHGPGNGRDYPAGLAVSASGGTVYMGGMSYDGSATRNDYLAIAYSAKNGAIQWSRRIDSRELPDMASAIALGPGGGRLYITGHSDSFGDIYLTLGLRTSSGKTAWYSHYDGPGTCCGGDYPTSLALAPGGSAIFITGSSWGDGSVGSYDFATVAFSTA